MDKEALMEFYEEHRDQLERWAEDSSNWLLGCYARVLIDAVKGEGGHIS